MHANLTNTTILHEPAEQYHRQAKDNLSSHQLGDFRRCPLLYRKKKLGLIPDEDRPAYLLGRGLHTLVLEGRDRFEAEYAVGGPVNPKTGEVFGATTKAFADSACLWRTGTSWRTAVAWKSTAWRIKGRR
jgi:hypothetical protein